MSNQPRLVYTTESPRTRAPQQAKGTQPNRHARTYVESMYDAETLAAMRKRIDWLRALCAERWEFVRLDYTTQANVDTWWAKRISKGTRWEGGVNVAQIQESLTQTRHALESDLASRENRR